ncbi:hypothetical protein CC1G_01454 [Coprinopsis cinerea okayama7|uniref:Uncharacterized protein n=1 Tax=Coprinopsis cinerea (strain Okayama-7 / 130 / ATCC MYA-4618 / FGSC 9003) TaxID=240176 RepID=A8NYW4_COPC7|nr:hypothetical protein CC1G_01454 [Coprinopsis cinerea okayama7\|eukprot:XP_001837542.2 hypothetical protein CC1G_01454 [Coprinopsis cinerea okayama7\
MFTPDVWRSTSPAATLQSFKSDLDNFPISSAVLSCPKQLSSHSHRKAPSNTMQTRVFISLFFACLATVRAAPVLIPGVQVGREDTPVQINRLNPLPDVTLPENVVRSEIPVAVPDLANVDVELANPAVADIALPEHVVRDEIPVAVPDLDVAVPANVAPDVALPEHVARAEIPVSAPDVAVPDAPSDTLPDITLPEHVERAEIPVAVPDVDAASLVPDLDVPEDTDVVDAPAVPAVAVPEALALKRGLGKLHAVHIPHDDAPTAPSTPDLSLPAEPRHNPVADLLNEGVSIRVRDEVAVPGAPDVDAVGVAKEAVEATVDAAEVPTGPDALAL